MNQSLQNPWKNRRTQKSKSTHIFGIRLQQPVREISPVWIHKGMGRQPHYSPGGVNGGRPYPPPRGATAVEDLSLTSVLTTSRRRHPNRWSSVWNRSTGWGGSLLSFNFQWNELACLLLTLAAEQAWEPPPGALLEAPGQPWKHPLLSLFFTIYRLKMGGETSWEGCEQCLTDGAAQRGPAGQRSWARKRWNWTAPGQEEGQNGFFMRFIWPTSHIVYDQIPTIDGNECIA